MNSLRQQFRRALIVLCLLVCVSAAQESASLEEKYSRAQRALTAGNYPEAEQAFEKLAQANPGIAEIHSNLGLIYFEERKFDQAVPELRRALKLKPSLSKSATVLAMSLSELGYYNEALPGLEKGFQSSETEIKRMCGLQLERAYTALQRDSKAVEVALELNRLYPDDPEVLYHNGKIFGNFAFLAMERLAQVAPASVWRHQALAEASESQGSYDAAIAEYRQVLAMEPQRPGIHYRLGRTLLARARATTSAEDRTAAAKEFQKELEVDPANANSAYELAELHRNAGEFEEAEKYFERALQNYPQFEEAHLGLAAVLMSLQKPDLALPHLKQAISLNRENEVSWYRLSQVEAALGNSSEQRNAMAEFQRLHAQKINQQEAGKKLPSPDEVTRQSVDLSTAQ
ncbi:MAG: tetratricopeptide repeat protein [Acidobacteria bacterium]|nr:tetratricopeptide repeat protein [Acidobacteriota bacterium]